MAGSTQQQILMGFPDVQTRWCEHIFGDGPVVEDFAEGVKTHKGWKIPLRELTTRPSSDGQNGGSGQGHQSTTSTPPSTASSGTQSTGTFTPSTSIGGGVGGSEPPEDGRGNPPIPGHYRDHQGEAESDGQENIENPGINAGVACDGCGGQLKSSKVYFTSGYALYGVMTADGVFCCRKCAVNKTKTKKFLVAVNFWDTETSSFKRCPVCFEFVSMPLTVCLECGSYMCGKCSLSWKPLKGKFRCSLQCEKGVIITFLPACIAEPARLEVVFENMFVTASGPSIEEIPTVGDGVEQPLFEDMFVTASGPSIEEIPTVGDGVEQDVSVTGTASGPPTEEYQPPTADFIQDVSVTGTASGPPIEENPTVEGGVEQVTFNNPIG